MWGWKLKIAVATAFAICVAGSLMYAHSKGKETGTLLVQAKWDQEKLAMHQAHIEELSKARHREQQLQAQADKIQQEKNREIAALNRRHAAALDSLRNRPERPADGQGRVPQAAGDRADRTWCTGSELYRPDAEFLIGLAQRADRLRLQLAACQAAYQSALTKE